ncbi:MAG TPA: EAL domain-containing protein [Thermoleophilaceae bacterium]|jgi:PAS domain S-box-containing protein
MTAPNDGHQPNETANEPADLAEVALGVTPEQVERYTAVIDRFLRGQYFSIDEEGKVASWHAAAEERFGWTAIELSREDFFEFVAARATKAELRAQLEPIFTGADHDGSAGRTLEIDTQARDGTLLRTEVAVVPIRVGDGYQLNNVLKDIMTHRGNPVELTRMKKRHADALRLLVAALDGDKLPDPLGDDGWQPGGGRIEQRWQPAGALVVFDDGAPVGEVAEPAPAAAEAQPPSGWNGSDALERMRDENHALRMRLREAESEAEQLRAELEESHSGAGGTGGRAAPDQSDPSIGSEDIQRALRENGFTLHCQPVLDLYSQEIAQHELLLRMLGADGELILPQAFLGTARRAGLLTGIDRWVVRRAIRTIGEQAQVGRDICLEVNLSGESLHDRALLPTIERELATTGIDPGRLVLEVTEQIAIADPEGARSLAKHLRAIGCGFALDDFGTSFGSFRFLKDMPVDYLKLDGDLIVSLTESRTAQLVVKALVDVARGTGAETIAVFASDDETLRMLRELGVGYAQGHKVGRPRPIGEALSAVDAQVLRPVEELPAAAQPVAAGTRKRAK